MKLKIYKSTKGDIVFAESAKTAREAFELTTEQSRRGRWSLYKDAPDDVVAAMKRAKDYAIIIASTGGYVHEEAV